MPTSFSRTSPDASLSRRERERLMRRQAMLDAAEAVFAEKGYARATLDEIAERAEFGKGTLYNYFEGGKEAILFAVFDEMYDDVVEIIEDTCDADRVREASLRSAYGELVHRAFSYFQEREDLFIILVKEAHRLAFSDDESKMEYFHRQRERVVNAIVPSIEAAMEAEAIRQMPPHAVAHMLLENLDGVIKHRCMTERRNAAIENGRLNGDVTRGEDDCEATDLLQDAEAASDFLTTMLFDGLTRPGSG